MFKGFKLGWVDTVQVLTENQIIGIQTMCMCNHGQGKGTVCHDSCYICVVKRILILEKDKTDLERRFCYLWAMVFLSLGQSSKHHLRLSLSLQKTRFMMGCLDQDHNPS